ncbi:hypothetical protein TrVGV298_005869 [Trichoderma virens]|nr:hypothetical protein TrVGV298_005869 [Trichoderma virens]
MQHPLPFPLRRSRLLDISPWSSCIIIPISRLPSTRSPRCRYLQLPRRRASSGPAATYRPAIGVTSRALKLFIIPRNCWTRAAAVLRPFFYWSITTPPPS